MPYGAKPLSVAVNPYGNDLVVWAIIEDEELVTDHRFWLTFTGQEFPREFLFGSKFMGTVKTVEMNLVIHCFYIGKVLP